jgi:hypothetical protein
VNNSIRLLPFHPLADIFPLMEGKEFEEFVADIDKHGLREEVALYQDQILDGRNRARACGKLGIEPRYQHLRFSNDDGARDYVISKNIHRRHLTTEQKRELIGKLLKTAPEKSDRQVAEAVKVSPTTVGTVRSKMEATGDVSKLDTRQDTKGRKQPAKKSKPTKTPTTKPAPEITLTAAEYKVEADPPAAEPKPKEFTKAPSIASEEMNGAIGARVFEPLVDPEVVQIEDQVWRCADWLDEVVTVLEKLTADRTDAKFARINPEAIDSLLGSAPKVVVLTRELAEKFKRGVSAPAEAN